MYSDVRVVIPEDLFGIATRKYVPKNVREDPNKMYFDHGLLEGPLFIPNFDQFISFSRLVSTNIEGETSFVDQFEFGQQLTNLLYYGDSDFATNYKRPSQSLLRLIYKAYRKYGV